MDRQTSPDAPLAVGGNSPGDGLPDGPGMPVPPPGRPTAAIPPVQNAQPTVPPPAQPAAAQPVPPAAPATPQPPAQPAPPPMQLPQPAVPGVAQPPAKTASPLVDAFIARCRELGMSDEETYVTAKAAAAMDPLLAEEFEKAAMPPLVAAALPWLGGLALRGLGRVGSLFGGSVGRAGASATARGASLSAKAKTIAARNTPAAAPAAAPASAAAAAPASATTTPATTGTWPSMTSGSEPTPAPTPAGPSLGRQLLVGAAPMGLMVGAPMAVEGVHARREATKQKNELEQASQLALASTQGDPHMYSAFAQQHSLAPHATEAMTRIMNVPEFRAMLTDQHRAGQFMAQLKHFSEMPGMTAETLSHMMANQLEAGAVVKGAAAVPVTPSAVGVGGRLAGLRSLLGLGEGPSVLGKWHDLRTQGHSRGEIARFFADKTRQSLGNTGQTLKAKLQRLRESFADVPPPELRRAPAVGPSLKQEMGPFRAELETGLESNKGLPRRARPTGAPADNLKPQVDGAEAAGSGRLSRLLELRHSPAVKWPALFGAGAATPSAADYVFGGESAQERAFTPLSAEPPSPAEGVKRPLPEPRVVKESAVKSAQPPAAAAPTPPEPVQPEQPGVMGQIGNTLGQAGNALSGFWSGLDTPAKITTGIGGGLLAGSALHGLTGVGPDLGAIGPLAGLGLTGYGLYRGGHLDGLIGSLRKLIGLDKDHDGTPDQQEAAPSAAPPAAAVGGPSKQLAAFRRSALTPKRAPVTGTTPAPTVAGGGLTLQQAATHPQFSKYFANGQLNKDALISASDADLTTAVRALHPDARGTLRQQVAAYQPNYIERTFGGADRHKARFQAILEKAGGISMLPRLRKAWQRGVSGVAASRFGQFMGKHPVAVGLGVAGGAVAVPLAVDLANGQALGSRVDSEAQKGQRRMYDALDTPGFPLKPRGSFDETRPVEEFRDALDLQPKEGAAQASVKVGADPANWWPDPMSLSLDNRYKDVLLPTEAPGAQLSRRDFNRLHWLRRLFADPTLHPSDRRKAEATLERFEPGQNIPQLPSPHLPRVIPSANMYGMRDPYIPGSSLWTGPEEEARFVLRKGIPKADLDRLDLLRTMEVARDTPYRDRMDVRREAESYTQAGWPKSPEPYKDYTGGKAGPTGDPAGLSRPAGDAQPNKPETSGGADANSDPSSSFVGRNWPYLVGGAGLLGLGAYGLHRLFRTKDKEEDDESQLPYTGLSAKKKASVRGSHLPLASMRDLGAFPDSFGSPPGSVTEMLPHESTFGSRLSSLFRNVSPLHRALIVGGGVLTAAPLLERLYRKLRRSDEDPDDDGPRLPLGVMIPGLAMTGAGVGEIDPVPNLGQNLLELAGQ